MFKLHLANIKKIIRSYEKANRKVYRRGAILIALEMIAGGHEYETATAACADYSAAIWNAGYVK